LEISPIPAVSIETLDDHDAWHPRTEFQFPTEESFQEELRREFARSSAVLDPKVRGLKVSQAVQLFQLRKVFDLLGHLFGESTEKKSDSTLAELLEFCWQPGQDGFAQANSESAFMRFGAASWVWREQWFRAKSQRHFGLCLKDDAALRCPNCTKRNKAVQAALAGELILMCPDIVITFLKSLLGPSTFIHGEMKKQSINRFILDFTDAFGVRNEHMRSDLARQKFKRLAAARNHKPPTDYSI